LDKTGQGGAGCLLKNTGKYFQSVKVGIRLKVGGDILRLCRDLISGKLVQRVLKILAGIKV
jgi:hypothetical protein